MATRKSEIESRKSIVENRKSTDPWTADQVAALRARLGLSQAELARRLGMRQQTVSEWETGRYAPRGASATLLGILAEEAAAYDATPPDGGEAPP